MAGADTEWERFERRLERVEREIDSRKDHAHKLEVTVRTLALEVKGMDDRMVDILSGLKKIDEKFESHLEQSVERRVSELQRREREDLSNRRFRWTLGVSIIGVFVVLLQIYVSIHQHALVSSGG